MDARASRSPRWLSSSERDDFLRSHAARGFWFTPPDGAAPLFVTADEWAATIVDRSKPAAASSAR